jgi:hypothetical protein
LDSIGIQFHSKELEWNWNGIGIKIPKISGIGIEGIETK